MKRVALLLLICVAAGEAVAQRDVDKYTDWSVRERGYLGLGFGGLGLGTSDLGRYFSIGVSPLAGYMLAKNFSGGVGFEYQYTSYSDRKIRIHQYGWYPFLRYNVANFFVQTDFDWYSIPLVTTSGQTQDRELTERFFVGIGYTSASPGSRSAANFLLSYDLLYTNLGSRFNSPLSIRIFLTF